MEGRRLPRLRWRDALPRFSKARRAGRAGQAALLLVFLAGCEAADRAIPVQVWRDLFSDRERPEPAPGGDRPFPNLASVPPRPVPPDAATRAAIFDSLAADRAASRAPLAPRGEVGLLFAPTPGFGSNPGAALGQPPMPSSPPPPASLPTPRAIPAAAPTPGRDADAIAPDPGAPPPPPPAELLAPPPPPADMLAPPRLR